MKKVLTKLLFGIMTYFSFQTAQAQTAQVQKKRLDEVSRFQKLGIVKIPKTTQTTADQTIYYATDVFSSIDRNFKDCYEEKISNVKDTVSVSVYKLNENSGTDSVSIGSVFDGMNMLALTQTEVKLFCQTKEFQDLFKTHQGGSIFFLFKLDPPPVKPGGSFIVYYYQFCIAEVKKKNRGKPSIKFHSPLSGTKIGRYASNLFVVLN